MATLEFTSLPPAQARAWLAERGLERRVDTPKTIAELHAMLVGAPPVGSLAPPDTGFR